MSDLRKHDRFSRLAEPLVADLYRFAMWLCGNDALAKDQVQETLLRAWRAMERLQDERAAKSWLITILRREYARTFERKVPPFTDLESLELPEEEALGPEADMERQLLRRSLLELAPRYREPLLLQVVMGLSCDEIAAQLGISKSAAMTQLFRARELLKARLGEAPAMEDVHGLF